MADLDPKALEHLWPFIQLLGAAVALLMFTALGLWRGFKWLQSQIERTAQAMLLPVSETAILAKRSARKGHIRISRLRTELGLPPDIHSDDELETKP